MSSSRNAAQLAKRKADELEDFGGPNQQEAFSQDVIDAGTSLMQQMLSSWVEQHPATGAADGEDVEMDDSAAELDTLKKCYEQYRTELEANPWCRSVLAGL